MDLRRISLGLVKIEIREFLDKKERLLGNKFLYSEEELDRLAESVMLAIEAADLEIEERFSELNVHYQEEEKPRTD